MSITPIKSGSLELKEVSLKKKSVNTCSGGFPTYEPTFGIEGTRGQLPKQLLGFLRKPVSQEEFDKFLRKPASPLFNFLGNLATGFLPFFCGKMHLIKAGEIGLSWYGDDPIFLDQGRHFLFAPTHLFHKRVKLSTKQIHHGPYHIIRVDIGQLGYAMDKEKGCPIIMEPGTHVIKNYNFEFNRFLDLNKPVNSLGEMKLVDVERGNVGYYYCQGELQILKPGMHLITPPDRYGGIISNQLQLLSLENQVHESADYVRVLIDADVYYRIVSPKKALLHVKDLKKFIHKTSLATLSGIVRSSNLSDIAGDSKATYEQKNKGKRMEAHISSLSSQHASAPSFQQRVHTEFLQELRDYMEDKIGISLTNIRINELKIADETLAKTISREAVDVAKQESEYRMLQKEAEIKEVKANNKAMEVRIAAQAQAAELKIKEQAKINITLMKAKADADAMLIRAEAAKKAKILAAQGEAQRIVEVAKAMKVSMELRGEADSKYSALMQKTPLGIKMAQLKVHAESIKGIQKIAYVPSLPGLMTKGIQLQIPAPSE